MPTGRCPRTGENGMQGHLHGIAFFEIELGGEYPNLFGPELLHVVDGGILKNGAGCTAGCTR